MPAHQLSRIRPRRPLVCDTCNKNIVPIAVVSVCGRCKHVRHIDCTKVPCTCGSWLKRSAVYRTGKIMRYF